MEINRMSISAQRVNITKCAVAGHRKDVIPQPVSQLIILQYRLFAQQSYKRARHLRCQFKFQLI